jgi:luciferase family oxidoreductase group 1
MLPNHAPLVVAEQFGTLASLFPGRIDLGLGRAPGTDSLTMRALRRDMAAGAERFPEDVLELQSYFEPEDIDRPVRAVPGTGLRVPLWLLGSSLFSAQLAAAFGLPFAFASHFAPDDLMDAIRVYRAGFKPSRQLERPYVMPAVNVFAADTDLDARYQFSAHQQASLNIRRGRRGRVPAPVDDIDRCWSATEKAWVEHRMRYSFVGAAETIESQLRGFLADTGADELMTTGLFHDPAARLRSAEIVAGLRTRLM